MSPPVENAPAAVDELTPRMPRWRERHPEAWLLEELPAGLELAAVADGYQVADLDDAALAEMVRAWERVISYVTARQASTIAEMLRRAPGSSGRSDVIGEVSAMLRVSPRSAQNRVEHAEALQDQPAVLGALEKGVIDPRRASELLNETAHLPREAVGGVLERVLPRAGDVSVPRLRQMVRREELLLDPAAAVVRHEVEKKNRCIAVRPAPDAMAWLEGYLPATQALTLMTAVDALAGIAAPEDQRSLDERRVDGLIDLAEQVLRQGTDLDAEPLPDRHGRHPHISLTAALTTATGQDDEPAYLGGYGLIPAALARDIMTAAPAHVVLCDWENGQVVARSTKSYRVPALLAATVEERDRTCAFVHCRVPAARCDIDHVEPHRADDRDSTDQTTYDNLQALCRHHHRMKTRGRWRCQRDAATGVTKWTSPAGHEYTRDPVPVHDAWRLDRPPPAGEPPPDPPVPDEPVQMSAVDGPGDVPPF